MKAKRNNNSLLQTMAFCVAAAMTGAVFGWTSVGPGIGYREFVLPHPNNAFVARMDRDHSACFTDSMLGGGRLGLSETIGSQASRYDEAVNHWHQDWGQRNDVVVAINGDFPDTSNNTPLNGQVISGWPIKLLTNASQRFYYTADQDLAIGYGATGSQSVRFDATGESLTIQGVNRVRGSNDLVMYTPQYHSTTRTDSSGVEVLVEMTRPAALLPASDPAVGYIRRISSGAGSTPLLFDHVVLSATGTPAANLLARSQLGARVSLILNSSGFPLSMHGTYASIGGGEVFLVNGQVVGGQAIRHPRTAIAYNSRYLYFVVVDGRSTSSAGMTMNELGEFCRDHLDATHGINQDGGGSSTMMVNGVLKNRPSGGSQRAVINGMFMGALEPKVQSAAFSSGDVVRTTGSANLRLGPGTNYLVLTTLGGNTQGAVVDHHLRGIYAKGNYWWKCNFNGTVGWVAQSLLASVSAGTLPRFTQHPSALHLCPGVGGSFSVSASGTGPLAYRWQFDGVDLEDAGSYSGTGSATLQVVAPSAAHVGSYRCVVSGPAGSTTSWSAPLRIMQPTTILEPPEPLTDPLMPRGVELGFAVRARGEGVLSYQWQKDGANISDSSHYSGTNTPALTVHAVSTDEEGEYRCVVTGACGATASPAAGLAVLSPDFDRDGDVDASDFGFLQACFSGSTIPQLDPACRGANLDNDAEQDVDQADLEVLLECWSGPDVPRPPGC